MADEDRIRLRNGKVLDAPPRRSNNADTGDQAAENASETQNVPVVNEETGDVTMVDEQAMDAELEQALAAQEAAEQDEREIAEDPQAAQTILDARTLADQRSQLLGAEREKHRESGKRGASGFTTDYLQSKIEKARKDRRTE